MLKPLGHLTSEKEMSKENNSDLISLQADVASLKMAMAEEKRKDIVKLDPNSQRFKEFREIEEKVHDIISDSLDDYESDPSLITKEKIELLGAMLNLLERYRNSKVQSELLQHTKFSSAPLVQ